MQTDDHSNKKIVWRIFLILFLIVLLVVGTIIGVQAYKNQKEIDNLVTNTLTSIDAQNDVSEVSCGDYDSVSVYGLMKYHVRKFNVEDVGNLCIMQTNIGVMQRVLIVLTPTEKNIPLMTAEYTCKMGNRTANVQCFDLVEEQNKTYKALLKQLQAVADKYDIFTDADLEEEWYDDLVTVHVAKSGTTEQTDILEEMITNSFSTELQESADFPAINGAERQEKISLTQDFIDNLVTYGGISTNGITNSLGTITTTEFFNTVLFGVSE